ncbi:MAG: succinylglutamate desuccinylase/aspartoacylase family protein [Chloroflexota bacterium]
MTAGKEATTLVVPAGADGDPLELPVLVARGRLGGPHVVVLGGVHGDEYEGVAATATVWRDLDVARLRGQVSIVSVANPPAFAVGMRTSPVDGANLARTFPGSPSGTLTERIAHQLSEALIRRADLLIDLHSAGQHYAMPLLCGSYSGADDLGRRCRAAALAFGAPVYWAHSDVSPGRSLSVALAAGVACIYAECGGGGRVRPLDLHAYRLGVCRVLAHIGALPPMDPAPAPGLRLRSSGDVDRALAVTHAGVLVEHTSVLTRVEQDDVLGEVVDERGATVQTLRAPCRGVVVMARRTARVRPGDGAYLIAVPDDSEEEEEDVQ